MVKLMGERLTTRRKEAQLTVTELAKRCGIDKGQMSRILRGQQPEMSVGNFFQICEVLMIDPLRAWYGDSRKPSSLPPPESQARPSRIPRA